MIEAGKACDRQHASWGNREASNMDQSKFEELKSREVGKNFNSQATVMRSNWMSLEHIPEYKSQRPRLLKFKRKKVENSHLLSSLSGPPSLHSG